MFILTKQFASTFVQSYGASCRSKSYAQEKFLLFNALGGIFWALIDGVAAYYFGKKVHELSFFLSVISFVGATHMVTAFAYYVKRHLKKTGKTCRGKIAGSP